ncbi:MAG: hypothetical protein NW200_03875 [Hyphomonadaceae bacterium]|nr:hypothetical protein [Hyphomonadaceae bacterium]
MVEQPNLEPPLQEFRVWSDTDADGGSAEATASACGFSSNGSASKAKRRPPVADEYVRPQDFLVCPEHHDESEACRSSAYTPLGALLRVVSALVDDCAREEGLAKGNEEWRVSRANGAQWRFRVLWTCHSTFHLSVLPVDQEASGG